MNKAEEQAELNPVTIDDITKLTNAFLAMCGVSCVKDPKIDDPKDKLIDSDTFYNQLKQDYDLTDRRDIIWMKFSEDGFLGVVASSDDINFLIPSSTADYTKTNDGKPKSKNND